LNNIIEELVSLQTVFNKYILKNKDYVLRKVTKRSENLIIISHFLKL